MNTKEQVKYLSSINYDNYKLIKSHDTFENGLKYTKQTYQKLDDKTININKTITEVVDRNMYNKYQMGLKKIEERKQWDKFGSGLTDPKLESNNEDEVFMTYNSAILIGNKNKTMMEKYITDRRRGEHKEDIRFYENTGIYNETLNNYKNYLELEDEYSLLQIHNIIKKYNEKLKHDLENFNNPNKSKNNIIDNSKGNSSDKGNYIIKNSINNANKSKNYTPPHKKKNRVKLNNGDSSSGIKSTGEDGNYVSYKDSKSNSKYTKNKEKIVDNSTIKISNLPSEYSRNDIFYLIKSVLPSYHRFNIKTITDKRTNRMKDFCFMNINNIDDSEEILNMLVNSKLKLEYNILNFELGYKRN